jgi:cellulose synthase/poly-beta-1,6-N-acetylglucosamine synthase-like glycosyltransferase
MLQFNGTGGVWRAKAIADAGGWQADTLTEDLDLSYRAQLKGWKINYLEEVGSPAELPAEMNGLKSQQYRWMKGGAETAKKVLPTIWSSTMSLNKKMHATGHLLSSAIFIFVFIAGVFSVPALITIDLLAWDARYFTFFLIGLLSIGSVYFVANMNIPSDIRNKTQKTIKFIILFPVFLALSMGLSLHNTIAVLQGFFGKRTPFVRTPKFNIVTLDDTFKRKNYFSRRLSRSTIGEGVLTLYFLFAAFYGVYADNMAFLFYHVLLFFGFGTIFFYSLKHATSK